MPSTKKGTNNKKKKNKKKNTRSAQEFFEKSAMPSKSSDIFKNTSQNLVDFTKKFASAFALAESNQNSDALKKFSMEMMAPIKITTEVTDQLRNLPTSEEITWFVDTNMDISYEASIMYCNVHLVDYSKSSDLAMTIASCIDAIEHEGGMGPQGDDTADRGARERDLVLGTFAKCVLQPAKSFSPMTMCSNNGDASIPVAPREKPQRLIVETCNLRSKILPMLKEMGMSKKQVAVGNETIIQAAKLRFKQSQEFTGIDEETLHNCDPNNDAAVRQALASSFQKKTVFEEEYVSERPKPMRGWVIPHDANAPLHWFIRPPSGNNYRLTQLWGWRTNLERAIRNADEKKVKSIANEHPIEELREYCEIRTLLQKMAEQGMKKSCCLLIDHCGASVEGVQAPDAKEEWRKMQMSSGDKGEGRTPLMLAAHVGQYAVCECLLERGAAINAVEWQLSSTALHFALVNGDKDVVKLLCKHGADISMTNKYGLDSLDLMEDFMHPSQMEKSGVSTKQMNSVLEILREYDDRCSHCRRKPAVLKNCPCHKEKYCDQQCQRARWKDHKKLHNSVMAKNSV